MHRLQHDQHKQLYAERYSSAHLPCFQAWQKNRFCYRSFGLCFYEQFIEVLCVVCVEATNCLDLTQEGMISVHKQKTKKVG